MLPLFPSSAAAAPAPATFAPVVDHTIGSLARALVIADVNGNGVLDLVAATSNDGVVVFLGRGDGTFGAAAASPVGDIFPSSLAIADFNRDGKTDAAAGAGQLQVGDGISVLLGRGDGTFGPPNTLSVGARSVAAGDLNGDRRPDLVAATRETTQANQVDRVSVLLGNGDGTFGTEAIYRLTVRDPTALAIGDLNGDDKQDLVTANGGGTVSVLLGNRDGTLPDGSFTTYGLNGSDPRAVVIADLNGDNRPDLATASANASYVSVLLGNGDGTFGLATPYLLAGGTEPRSLAVGDFNHDNVRDLATANRASGDVSMLLGNGDGTLGLAATVTLTDGEDPEPLASGDLNGDGWVDLAVGYEKDVPPFSLEIGVLLNAKGVAAPPPPSVSITTPFDGAFYTFGSVPASAFSCSPGDGATLRPGLRRATSAWTGPPGRPSPTARDWGGSPTTTPRCSPSAMPPSGRATPAPPRPPSRSPGPVRQGAAPR